MVQFWDCSGDKQYQRCWPALAHSALGLLLVYDADKGAAAQESELEDWYRAFGQPNALRENQSLIIGNCAPPLRIYSSPLNLSLTQSTGIQQQQAHEPSELRGKLRKLQHKVLDLFSAQQANLLQIADSVDAVIAAAVDAAIKQNQGG